MTKKKSKIKKTLKQLKKDFNIIIGTIIFVLLIGVAFTIDWLFGIFFVVGFILSILNKTLEHKPLIPILIFVGGLIIRIALFFFVPRILEAGSWADLIIAAVMLLIVLFIGFSIRRGKV
jgi:hypothetical protein